MGRVEGGRVIIRKIKIGFGNTCGPSYQPVKVYLEYEAEFEFGAEFSDGHEAEKALGDKCLQDLHDWCLEALLRLKGAEEAKKFEAEKAGKGA